jgi:hypothetical protein
MGLFSMDPQKWAAKYDAAATDFLGEPVVAACQFTRTGGWAQVGLAQVSGLGSMVAGMQGKKKAGGLPQTFLLAVTPQRLYALGLPRSSSGLKVRVTKELGRWDLCDITATTSGVLGGTKITIDAPAEGEHVEVQGPAGALTDRVAQALGAVAVAK